MKKSNIIGIVIVLVLIAVSIGLIGWYLSRPAPDLIQGTIECTTYKASSKIAGRIYEMNVEQGQRVEKGDLLYSLSTPELDAKLHQAQAVRSAASAMDQKALTGARSEQKQAALNMWQKAQAGRELAQKTFDRVQRLYEDGVVPAQKYDEANANLQAMLATEMAAKAQYDLVRDGASKEDKEAAAAQLRQAESAVNEVLAYLEDAKVYAPASGEVSTVIAEAGELVGTGYPVVNIIDTTDVWATFNIKEDMLPHVHQGTRFEGFIPALGCNVEFEVTYIAVQADFATWNATRTKGGFDIRTFAVKAKPVTAVENIRPGMSVIVNWNEIAE